MNYKYTVQPQSVKLQAVHNVHKKTLEQAVGLHVSGVLEQAASLLASRALKHLVGFHVSLALGKQSVSWSW